MDIVIYNINSFGGNYEYSKELFNAYKNNREVTSVVLLMPKNSPESREGIELLLTPDKSRFVNKILRKVDYLFKGVINPLKLFWFLRKRKKTFVIFNDYDQTTSFIWVPIMKILKKKHKFSVILHDPDRDKFLPWKWMSEFTMKKIMSLMHIAFHHGFLPDKSYYNFPIKKITIPHGLYPSVPINQNFYEEIKAKQTLPKLLGIIGNIRDEKNYDFILNILPFLDNCQLLVAGKIANSKVPIDRYKKLIVDLKLENKVIWIERYLDDDELNAAIYVSDVVLLYYKTSFTSQSGILNNIAPYRKKLLVTDTQSALREVVKNYKLGELVQPDDQSGFMRTIKRLITKDDSAFFAGWDRYSKEATWERHVAIAISHFKQLS